MTDEEIDAMEAGREMDAEVHRLVFPGCHVWKQEAGFAWLSCNATHEHGGHREWDWLRLPNYSTHIAAAWLVVEKLCADGGNFTFFGGAFGPGSQWPKQTHKWVANFDDYGDDDANGYAPTMSLAICRAALKCCKNVADKNGDTGIASPVVEPIAESS